MNVLRIMVVVALVGGTVPSAMAQKCDALSETARRALQLWIKTQFDPGNGSDCGLTLGYAARDLASDRAAAVPCLLEIFDHGLTRSTGLWSHADRPAPTKGQWVLPLMSSVDPPTALRLYRVVAKKSPPGSEERIRAELEVAKLGGDEPLPNLVEFLAQAAGADSPGRRTLMLEIAGVLAERDYVAAGSAVRGLAGTLPATNTVIPVYVAQLSRDTRQLQQLARTSGSASIAVHALLRIGRRDLVACGFRKLLPVFSSKSCRFV